MNTPAVRSTEVITIQNINASALSVEDMRSQIHHIQAHMRENMKEGEHFGLVPGCGEKKTLLKAGAEKLSFIFQLTPEFKETVIDLPRGHREYRVTCVLTHRPSSTVCAAHPGSCTTMEGKYRFRTENTNQPVPPAYWNGRDSGLLGGPAFKAKKINNEWKIVQQVEHDNPADYYNTCLKMACKRAHVGATLAALAASDLFTQDVEDMPEVIAGAAIMQERATQRLLTNGDGGVRQAVREDVPREQPRTEPPREQPMYGDLADDNILKFGKHKGTRWGDVPVGYLKWWSEQPDSATKNPPLYKYAEQRMEEHEAHKEAEAEDQSLPAMDDFPTW